MARIVKNDRAAVWHPFTQEKTAMPPIPIHEGRGSYLHAMDGTRYLDGISSWWVNLHGHAHPYIARKIAEQAHKLEHVMFAGFTHPTAVDLATKLLPLLPGQMGKVFYSDNGSTAVEIALKMAIQYWYNRQIQKTKVICFEGGYHGDTFGAMSVGGKNAFNRPFWNQLFEVEVVPPPLPGQEGRSLQEIKKAIACHQAACFIFEPLVLGVGGMQIYPAKHLDSIIQLCHQHDVITIADEVMTGFGRTGTLFACDQVKEPPDIICLSKGITGGFLPLGVTACHHRIYREFLSDDTKKAFLHGHSYTANPIVCASALASLELLQTSASHSQRKMIENSHANFCRQWKDQPKLKRCEFLGTLLVLEYQVENPSYFSSIRDRLYQHFIKRGILLRPLGNVLYVLPPYCISKSELNGIYEAISLTLNGEL